MSVRTPASADQEIGARVRARRLELTMTQVAVANALGVTQQQVQKYENGTNRIPGSRVQILARILGVPVTHFYGEADPETTRLMTSFERISDQRKRLAILSLVETMAYG